ncbi:hypothetical protein Ndes2526B_g07157 [Nannochloris sp. 'desiccata']
MPSNPFLSQKDFIAQHISSLLDPATNKPRFSNVRIVGEGGQGYVAAAHDSVRGQEVALKILETATG